MPANTGKNIDIHRHFKMTSQHDKEQMMKGIPASYIPTICIQELAITMDPKSDMPGKDYRHFAELNGILPKEWQYLDSQKCQGSTSSFYNVMQWLMHQHDDCFTVFTVYETFKKMESRGTKILDKYLPAIESNYLRDKDQDRMSSNLATKITVTPQVPNSHQSIMDNISDSTIYSTAIPQDPNNGQNIIVSDSSLEMHNINIPQDPNNGQNMVTTNPNLVSKCHDPSNYQNSVENLTALPELLHDSVITLPETSTQMYSQVPVRLPATRKHYCKEYLPASDNIICCQQTGRGYSSQQPEPCQYNRQEKRGKHFSESGWLGVHLVGRQMDMDITRSFMRQEMNNLPPHVLIVGGDEKDPEGLSGEIHSLCDFLHQKDITCVAVFPSDQMPLSQQWKAYQELEAFIQECYLKARKIVVAISPGYNEYAEEHRNGARASATLHQKIIRQLHEKMKEEYIKIRYQSKSRKTRLIPVLLTKLKTKAHHCPDFLQLIKCNKFELNTSSRLPLHRYFPGNHEKLLSLITSK